MGLWNRLSRHQDRNAPFRLARIETGATREGLAALAMLRRQELEGFVEGLFGKEEALRRRPGLMPSRNPASRYPAWDATAFLLGV
jgi:hypothetical protein